MRRVALVHEYFCNLGGAEVTVRALHEMFPDAPVYALLIYDRNRGHEWLRGMELRTSFLQRLPLAGRTHQIFLPLMPLAIEQFDFSGYELILSSSSLIAKGILPPLGATHFSFTHTRQRAIYDMAAEYLAEIPRPLRWLAALSMHQLRVWDVTAAQRVDQFIANSNFVARRIEQLYRRDAVVIPPPVDTDTFAPSDAPRGDYYVAVGRLVNYKRFDLAVEACKRLGRPLHVIGDGPMRNVLAQRAGPDTKFLGSQPHTIIRQELAGAKALLFPGLEDFGLVPVEAQAVGCPVIAYGEGGALDTVCNGETGILFQPQTVEALVQAMEAADGCRFDPRGLRENALRFSTSNFKKRMNELVA